MSRPADSSATRARSAHRRAGSGSGDDRRPVRDTLEEITAHVSGLVLSFRTIPVVRTGDWGYSIVEVIGQTTLARIDGERVGRAKMSDLDRQPLFFPGDEIHQVRVERVAAALQAHDLDGLLLLKHDAVRYVTGFYAKGYRPFIDFDYAALVRRDRDTVLGYTVGGEERRIALRSRVSDSFRLPSFNTVGSGPGRDAEAFRGHDRAARVRYPAALHRSGAARSLASVWSWSTPAVSGPSSPRSSTRSRSP